jgi:hypothetical protein
MSHPFHCDYPVLVTYGVIHDVIFIQFIQIHTAEKEEQTLFRDRRLKFYSAQNVSSPHEMHISSMADKWLYVNSISAHLSEFSVQLFI